MSLEQRKERGGERIQRIGVWEKPHGHSRADGRRGNLSGGNEKKLPFRRGKNKTEKNTTKTASPRGSQVITRRSINGGVWREGRKSGDHR